MTVAVCLLVGAALTRLPTDHFTLSWIHSVQKTEWQEDYRVGDGKLRLTEARIQGSGAGMDPPAGARLEGGWWHYRPPLPDLPELRLTVSPYTADYRLCWQGGCHELQSLIGPHDPVAVVAVRPCA